MVGTSQSLESVVHDPFDSYCAPHDSLSRERFFQTNWATIIAARYPFSARSLNKKGTVYALADRCTIVKYLPLTKSGHGELYYTRLFSGELGPKLLDVSVLETGVEMVLEKADMPLSGRPISDPDHLLVIARDLAFLCYELELRGLGHYDLKADNVLCYLQDRDRDVLCLADFGFTMPIRRFEDFYFGLPIGTPGYIPPEAYHDDPDQLELLHTSSLKASPCSRSDLFAYGVLLSTLIRRKNDVAHLDRSVLKQRMLTGAYRDDILHFSAVDATPELQEVVYSCTHRDPRARPASFGDVLCVLGDP